MPTASERDRQWYILSRWQEYEGEIQVNILRVATVCTFYLVHLANYYHLRIGSFQIGDPAEIPSRFHQIVTLLVTTWVFYSLGLMVALQRRFLPAWLKFVSTTIDVVLLTTLLCLTTGPQSSLVIGYVLILLLAALRFNLPLIRYATVLGMAGYLVLLGCARWPALIGRPDAEMRVERSTQLLILLAIGTSGVLIGQIIRRVRSMAQNFIVRVEKLAESASDHQAADDRP